VKYKFHFQFGRDASFGFPPKSIGNHISRDSKRGGKFGEDRWRIVLNK